MIACHNSVVGLRRGKLIPKTAVSALGSDSAPALPIGLRGMLCSHPLKHFLLAFDPPTAVKIALPDRLKGGSMLTTDNGNATFDPAVFLAHAGLGRRIIELRPNGDLFHPGRSGRLRLLSSERPGKTHRGFAERQRGHHHASLRRRLRWRGVSRGGAWAAPVPRPPPSTPAWRSRSRGKR